MKQQFVVRGYHAISDQDNYENGCFGKHQSEWNDHFECKAGTLKELMSKLAEEFCSVDTNDFLLDSCEDIGRLDLQVWQREAFNTSKPSEKTVEKWKAGEIDLWLTCYTFYVELIQTELNLTEILASEEAK